MRAPVCCMPAQRLLQMQVLRQVKGRLQIVPRRLGRIDILGEEHCSRLMMPVMRRVRASTAGTRVRFRCRHRATASDIGLSSEMVTASASGIMTWRTRRLGRSRTRLIMAFSSEVKPGAASCMTKRNSSRLPKRRPVRPGRPSNATGRAKTMPPPPPTAPAPGESERKGTPTPATGDWDNAGRVSWAPVRKRCKI